MRAIPFRLPALLAAAALLAPAASWAGQQPAGQKSSTQGSGQSGGRSLSGDLVVTPVRGSVHMLVMPSAGNVGVSAGEDGAFIIDDQFAPMAPKIAEAVKKLTDQPIRYVLNTHWHGDHTGGNESFGRQGVVIVAHDNVRKRMSTEQFTTFFNSRTPPSPAAALPVITFSHRMTFHFNGDTIRVVHLPHAHTDGDTVFYFEKADVLHAGDVFVSYGYPFIDLSSGGSVMGTIAALDQIIEHIGPETIVIPGHGAPARLADVQRFHDMLDDARGRIASLVTEGRSLEETVAAKPLADLDAEWGKGFVTADRFVAILYESEKNPPDPRRLPARHVH